MLLHQDVDACIGLPAVNTLEARPQGWFQGVRTDTQTGLLFEWTRFHEVHLYERGRHNGRFQGSLLQAVLSDTIFLQGDTPISVDIP